MAVVLRAGGEPVTLTYGRVATDARRYARWYVERGVSSRQHIVMMLDYGEHVFGAFLGAMRAGAVPSIFPAWTPRQDPALFWAAHQAVFDRIQPAVILSDAHNLDMLRAHVRNVSGRLAAIEAGAAAERAGDVFDIFVSDDETAFLQHSSGTTGLKKGVALSHRMVSAQVDSLAAVLAIAPDDIFASWVPLYHDLGLIACFLMPAMLGLTTVYLNPFEWVLRPWTFLDAVQAYRATIAWQPNLRLRTSFVRRRRAATGISRPFEPSSLPPNRAKSQRSRHFAIASARAACAAMPCTSRTLSPNMCWR